MAQGLKANSLLFAAEQGIFSFLAAIVRSVSKLNVEYQHLGDSSFPNNREFRADNREFARAKG